MYRAGPGMSLKHSTNAQKEKENIPIPTVVYSISLFLSQLNQNTLLTLLSGFTKSLNSNNEPIENRDVMNQYILLILNYSQILNVEMTLIHW